MERSDNGVRAVFSNCNTFLAGVTVMTPVFCMFLKRICGEFSFVPLRAVLYVFRETKPFRTVLKRNEVLFIEPSLDETLYKRASVTGVGLYAHE